jgi:hypothetical protein
MHETRYNEAGRFGLLWLFLREAGQHNVSFFSLLAGQWPNSINPTKLGFLQTFEAGITLTYHYIITGPTIYLA